MERQEVVEIVKQHVTNKNLFKHCLAVEAIMEALAKHLCKDRRKWAMAGLVHDIDYDSTFDKPEKHSLEGGKMLKEMGFEQDIVHAVEAHNEIHGIPRESMLDKALFSADPISGLITACALILPSKKLSEINASFVLRRMDEKLFAKGANREHIRQCSEMGLSLEKFIEISLKAMQEISDELGL